MKSMATAAKAVVALLLVAAAVYFNKSGLFQKTLDWIRDMGTAAPWMFLGVYVLTCIFFVPSFVFTFASGILFGLWKGVALSVVGAGIGSTAAFLIGRYLARDWVEKSFAANREFQALSGAVRAKGWKIVLLARLSPIFPFLVGNYAFGLTPIRAGQYLLATMVGTLPSTSVYAYAGTVTGSLAALGTGRQRTPAEWVLLGAGLVATAGFSFYLRSLARKALQTDVSGSSGEKLS